MQKVTVNCETGEEIYEDLTPEEEAENEERRQSFLAAQQAQEQQEQARLEKREKSINTILESPALSDDVRAALMHLLDIESINVP
ncbi:MAG TPA: hypothetical protein VEP90_04310 [Methylomirabilota bacterium]|nr:hypothetical protein [Methylomirabilota bacterium]